MADRRLQVFHAVAKQLSFTKAAEALYMTQPAVTFQIKQLEEHFNTRLFDRGHGRISLTPAGELVLEYAERILGQYADLEAQLAEMTGQMRGPLLVGATITIAEFMLPRVLGEFNTLFPQVRARLSVGNSETIEHRIIEHSLDIGLTEATEHLPGLEVDRCCEDELQVICAPSHPLAKLVEIHPSMLLDHAFISREPGSGTREISDNYFRSAGIAPENLKVLMELG
ncbi:MAG: LysR family transcriptional regulator, partial [Betaproteobacteria bacterium]|nr:LysR family transcriptional regulator [Betaproteobacteria bacterium]